MGARTTSRVSTRSRAASFALLLVAVLGAPTVACTGVLGDFKVGIKGQAGTTGTAGGDDDGTSDSGCTGASCTSGDDDTDPEGGAGDDDAAVAAHTLTISPTSAMLSRGDMIQVAVDLSFVPTTAEDILLATAPLGVTADPLRLPAGTSSGTLTLHVGLAAAAGMSNVLVVARVPGRTLVTPDASTGTMTGTGATDSGATDGSTTPKDSGTDGSTGVKPDAGSGTIATTGTGLQPGDLSASFALTVSGPNGGPDLTFGTSGVLVLHVSAGADVPYGLAFDSQGRVVIVGTRGTPQAMVLARITEAGALDMTYGTTGYATVTGVTDTGTALALRSDDGAYAAGVMGGTSLVASFTSSGQLDTTFAAGKGYVNIDSGGGTDLVNAVGVEGTSVVVGGSRTLGGKVEGLLLGFTSAGAFTGEVTSPGALPATIGNFVPNGAGGYWLGGLVASQGVGASFDSLALGRGVAGSAQFDGTFGTDGFLSAAAAGANFGASTYSAGRAARQSTGRLLVAGTPVGGATQVVGYTTGAGPKVDTTFAAAGVLNSTSGTANDIAVDSADRILIAGSDGQNVDLQRFTPNGGPDSTFTDGLGATPVLVTSEATRVAVDPKGRVIVIGKAQATMGDDDWLIARFLP